MHRAGVSGASGTLWVLAHVPGKGQRSRAPGRTCLAPAGNGARMQPECRWIPHLSHIHRRRTWGQRALGHWRTHPQRRGDLWRVLRSTCHMAGIRRACQQPRGTSQTCPHGAQPAATSRDSSPRSKREDGAAWRGCPQCGCNGARDDAAPLNIARVGAHFSKDDPATGTCSHASSADGALTPVSSMGSGPVLGVPPMVPGSQTLLYARRRDLTGGKRSVALCSSSPSETMVRLCG